ncbi:MAG TPA: exoglucanase, partial [Clostridiales bacterium]|nr:exoglucanase [Clostridiales bacterium]
ELLDRMWNLYRDDKGVGAPEERGDYSRFFEQEIYVPDGWSGTMPNGDVIEPGVSFLDIRSKYLDDPDYAKLEAAYKANEDPEFTYHRFWAQCDVAIANGVSSILFEDEGELINNSSITPTKVDFDKKTENQEDITVNLTLNGNTLEAVRAGNTNLIEGRDYTVVGNVVTINKTFLSGLDEGILYLVFEFSAGRDSTLVVTIVDTTGGTVDPDPIGDYTLTVNNSYNSAEQSNTITNNLTLKHSGGDDIDLSKLNIRYYYTKEGTTSESFQCDHAAMQLSRAPWYLPFTSVVDGNLVRMSSPKTNADSYIDIAFDTTDIFTEGDTITINTRTHKNDWSNYDQTNDYSYANVNRISIYYGDELIFGNEP